MVGAAKSRVLFLGGLGRSGSTLLERLLGQVDGMQALGETVHLWARSLGEDEKCGCGQPFSQCEFWLRVGAEAFGSWSAVDVERVETLRHQVDRMRHVPTVLLRPAPELETYTDYYARLYAGAHAASGATWLIDSSKHPSLAFCLRRRADIDFRVLHVVRHPCAVAYSWTKLVERPDQTAADQSGEFMTQYSPRRTAALWDGENAAVELLRRLGVPVHRVRYEDLVTDPEAALRGVLDFAGLPVDTAVPVHGHTAELVPIHTASGNPMRFTTGEITIRSDDKWRTEQSARDRRTVSALTWPLTRVYGYGAKARRVTERS